MFGIETIIKHNQYAALCREAGKPITEALDILTNPMRGDERRVMNWLIAMENERTGSHWS